MRTDLGSDLRLGYVHLNRPSSTSHCSTQNSTSASRTRFTLIFIEQLGGEMKCMDPKTGDADLWIKIWKKHVKAHRTAKDKKEMSHFEVCH